MELHREGSAPAAYAVGLLYNSPGYTGSVNKLFTFNIYMYQEKILTVSESMESPSSVIYVLLEKVSCVVLL